MFWAFTASLLQNPQRKNITSGSTIYSHWLWETVLLAREQICCIKQPYGRVLLEKSSISWGLAFLCSYFHRSSDCLGTPQNNFPTKLNRGGRGPNQSCCSGKQALTAALRLLGLAPKDSPWKQPEIFHWPIKAFCSRTEEVEIQQEGMFYPLGGFLNPSTFTALL